MFKNFFQSNNKEFKSEFNDILEKMDENCQNMLSSLNELPDSEEKQNLINELNKQRHVINQNSLG